MRKMSIRATTKLNSFGTFFARRSCDHDVNLYFPPNVFRQANQKSFARIIDNARGWLKENAQAGGYKKCLEVSLTHSPLALMKTSMRATTD